MPTAEMLRYGGAVAAVYFLVTMLLALIHDEPTATAKAWGLGLSLLAMAAAGLIEVQPPVPIDPTFRPPRLPALPPDGAGLFG